MIGNCRGIRQIYDVFTCKHVLDTPLWSFLHAFNQIVTGRDDPVTNIYPPSQGDSEGLQESINSPRLQQSHTQTTTRADDMHRDAHADRPAPTGRKMLAVAALAAAAVAPCGASPTAAFQLPTGLTSARLQLAGSARSATSTLAPSRRPAPRVALGDSLPFTTRDLPTNLCSTQVFLVDWEEAVLGHASLCANLCA